MYAIRSYYDAGDRALGEDGVLVGHVGVVDGGRGVVGGHFLDDDGDGGGVGQAGAVGDGVDEAVGAVEIGRGQVGEGAVGGDRDGAVA